MAYPRALVVQTRYQVRPSSASWHWPLLTAGCDWNWGVRAEEEEVAEVAVELEL